MKIGILGVGKLGEALIRGMRERNKQVSIIGSTRSKESAKEVSQRLKIKCVTDNRELVQASDVIILCVKPHQAEAVLRPLKGVLTSKHLLISVCAALTTEQLQKWTSKKVSIIRAMPNTPALVGEGMTALALAKGVSDKHADIALSIFNSVGKTIVLEESHMDAVTGLSGCGPAYVYLVVEALSEAGVKVGLARKTATLLAAQTLLGAARMILDRDVHPAELKDEVTTPAGCTIDGLMALEEGGLRVTLIRAVLAATKRSKALAKKK